jgi:hypothetical protein
VGAREARREAARRNSGKPRERCKAGSRDGSEPRKGHVTGVGWRIRTAMVRGASRWLPWSRRGRLGRGLSDTTPARRQRSRFFGVCVARVAESCSVLLLLCPHGFGVRGCVYCAVARCAHHQDLYGFLSRTSRPIGMAVVRPRVFASLSVGTFARETGQRWASWLCLRSFGAACVAIALGCNRLVCFLIVV